MRTQLIEEFEGTYKKIKNAEHVCPMHHVCSCAHFYSLRKLHVVFYGNYDCGFRVYSFHVSIEWKRISGNLPM